MNKELKKLETYMDKKILSKSQLASELGYASPAAVYYWFKKGEVPRSALQRVRDYIKKKKL